MPGLPLVIGHRGWRAAFPENTFVGMEHAIELGVDAIEIDVHVTADRVPVVIHDASVERTTNGEGTVASLTLEQLRGLDAGHRQFDGRFAGQPVPTLAEVRDLCRNRCLLVVEIKARDIEHEVVEVLRGAEEECIVWSFHQEVVGRMREIEPSIPAALLVDPRTDATDHETFHAAIRNNAQAVSLHYSAVTEGTVWAAARRGLSIYCWTANDAADHARLAAARVTGIVTDAPDVLLRALARTP